RTSNCLPTTGFTTSCTNCSTRTRKFQCHHRLLFQKLQPTGTIKFIFSPPRFTTASMSHRYIRWSEPGRYLRSPKDHSSVPGRITYRLLRSPALSALDLINVSKQVVRICNSPK